MSGWIKWTVVGSIVVIALIFGVSKAVNYYAFRDDDVQRGAIAIADDEFDGAFETPIYQDQGWRAKDSLWFYTATQGSDLLPYDFFIALEQADSTELFRDNKNINHYRYLPQKPTASNPDGLPVGFVLDTYKGKDYLGFTCAACHTAQINYQGKAIRIDGGPGAADLNSFMLDLNRAMRATRQDKKKLDAFVQRVLARNGLAQRLSGGRNFTSEQEVVDELEKYSQRLARYNAINYSHVKYGYARLDAFGRIYNRVLEHILTKDQLAAVLAETLPADEVKEIMAGIDHDTIKADEFDHVINKLETHVNERQLLKIRNKLFNSPDAPVSYPFLWDIAQHDYVQWNGIASNAGLGPIGRNTGEVIGVFATLDWEDRPHTSLSALIGGQYSPDHHVSYKSSVDLANLRRIESKLAELQSPQWPSIFPAIDRERAARGRKHFEEYCSRCHFDIDRGDPERKVIAQMTKLEAIQTDPKMAANSVNYSGYSGIIKGQTFALDAGRIYIQPKSPLAALLSVATTNVVATPDPDKSFIHRWADWAYELSNAFVDNLTPTTMKSGNYNPDTTAAPLASLLAYKARPLNGIWATAPYLHNGSVPTLYDLLLPKKRAGDPEQGEYRPDEFWVGKREFDPVKVGFVSSPGQGFRFLTNFVGNSNDGHDYGTGHDPVEPGEEPRKPLTPDERWELVEYLKTL